MATRKHQKERRFRFIILACLLLIPCLTYLETRVLLIGETPFPVSGNVLVFILININVLLLLLMVFLVLRRLAELIFERRQKILGTRLRTKLVISFVSLSLIPTALLFFIALQFVSTSMDYWFNANVDQSLQESLNIAKDTYQQAKKQVLQQAEVISAQIQLSSHLPPAELSHLFDRSMSAHGLQGLELISDERQTVAKVSGGQLAGQELPTLPAEQLRLALAGEEQVAMQQVAAGELVRGIKKIVIGQENDPHPYLLVASLLITSEQLQRMEIISKGLEGYRQLMIMKKPIKTSLLVMLLIVTLLIVFCAIWFGFYVAEGLTGPIGKLAAATRRVAEGELDFSLPKESDDEMGQLVASFNLMTRDLLLGKQQLEEANRALRQSNLEADERRRYLEIILQNVAAGVISFDQERRITTINRFAEELLKIDRDNFLARDYRETMLPEHLEILEGFLTELQASGKASIQRPLRLTVRKESFSLLVNCTRLEDENHNPLGVVLVFDNLTQLEKAQRAAAWREVAKRIAHEVKNPLTPIQLSAQRLRKRYLEALNTEGEVFDLCTRTIIDQVDELKRLVSEFSNFARMPAVQKSMNNLEEMVKEVLILYREAHKQIEFRFASTGSIPSFNFDRKQIRRVLINLLDNGVAALAEDGIMEIALFLNEEGNAVFMEVRDNGPGVADQDKFRLFEPYFSTKKSGTGLGLAIASTIVADHGGYIRVRDNEPRGAVFIVELPLTD